MNKNEKGFTLVEALLILLAISFISFAGWYVISANNSASTVPATNSSSQEQSTINSTESKDNKSKSDETANWFLFTSPDNSYQIRLADGWELTRYVNSSSIVSFKPLVYKEGVRATVTETENGRGGPFPLYIKLSNEAPNVRGKFQGEIRTDSGLTGQKYTFTQTEEGGHDLQVGEKEYTYHFSKSGKYLTVVHGIFGESKDNTEYVEKAIKTLSIN